MKQGVFCENEAEFRAYTVLMNLNEGDILRLEDIVYNPLRIVNPLPHDNAFWRLWNTMYLEILW